ncbi:MAG: ImmA/IrrE family metallo-endopeptidase [Candidatus Omnitrophica bacterium]|nr:ImmA/IrrE family metallo-endopeptidase [Candidatus Omnitrophota bacterium]
MSRVTVKPEMLLWACERSGQSPESMHNRFPKLELWSSGKASPTLKQLENFARATYTSIGFLFLQEPPVEKVPIPDFRTVGNKEFEQPSPDLLDTIYICQQRQEWYREFMRASGEKPLQFVGSASIENNVKEFAESIRHALGFDIEERRKMRTWVDALRSFIDQADELGILIMVNGVVGNNNWRKLDPYEFRGFALVDDLSPLVFINGSDTKSAQMFTLAHELAHIWLGQSALSDAQVAQITGNKIERWCNLVAAELLVPLTALRNEYQKSKPLFDEVNRLARHFKVSTLVILRRIYDAGGLNEKQFWKAYNKELDRLLKLPSGTGGNFYLTQTARVSKRFASALIANTLEGQTLYRDAFRMLGFSKLETFRDLGHTLGVV